MANPSPQAIAAIQARVTALGLVWAGQSDAAILAALKADTIDNPTPQGTVPKPFKFADVMGCLGESSVANIRDTATTTDLIDKINAGDAAGIGHWIAALQASPAKITATEASNVMAVITATQHDPNYQPKLVVIEQTIGRPIDLYDVQASRPGA